MPDQNQTTRRRASARAIREAAEVAVTQWFVDSVDAAGPMLRLARLLGIDQNNLKAEGLLNE
jgi:hypothetical protein